MVYACDNNACESFRQFVESQSNPHYLVFVVFNIEESVIGHCRCYIACNSPTDTSYPVLPLTTITRQANRVSVTQTHDTSLRDETDRSSSAFSILSERAFTPRITGNVHRVLSTRVIKLRASERDAQLCCLDRP